MVELGNSPFLEYGNGNQLKFQQDVNKATLVDWVDIFDPQLQ